MTNLLRAVAILVVLGCQAPKPVSLRGSAIQAVGLDSAVEWIHEFANDPIGSVGDGASVRGALVELDGRFYGLAGERGPNQGGSPAASCASTAAWNTIEHTKHCPGTLFSVARAGDLRVEHAFTRLNDTTSNNADGYHPYGSLALGLDRWLYGVTQMGGTPAISGARGSGVLFRYRAGAFETLHSFFSEPRGADGLYPMGRPSILPDGRVCGVAKGGGDSGNGAVWCWSPAASFTHASMPPGIGESTGGVSYSAGKLHGVTNSGGAAGAGVYFTVDPDDLAVHVVDSFPAAAVNSHGTDNTSIQAPLVLSNGALMIARQFAGQFGTGAVVRLDPTKIVMLKVFDDIPITATPRFANVSGGMANGQIDEGCDGMIYGTTAYGGAAGAGTVYQIARDGTRFKLLASFQPGGPSYPYGGLVRGSDCALWGTTFNGGRVFRVVPSSALCDL